MLKTLLPSQAIETPVNAREGVRITNFDGTQSPLVDSKAKRAVRLGEKIIEAAYLIVSWLVTLSVIMEPISVA